MPLTSPQVERYSGFMNGPASALFGASLLLLVSCGGKAGLGTTCAVDGDCESVQKCLLEFKGGYCGLRDCVHDTDCPSNTACVEVQAANQDGGASTSNYCFLVCSMKDECNHDRPATSESNCSSTAVFVDGTNGRKACVPPSGG